MDCTRTEAAALLMELSAQAFLRDRPLDKVTAAQQARIINGLVTLLGCTPARAAKLLNELTPEAALERIKK